jgi:hypothetical protein
MATTALSKSSNHVYTHHTISKEQNPAQVYATGDIPERSLSQKPTSMDEKPQYQSTPYIYNGPQYGPVVSDVFFAAMYPMTFAPTVDPYNTQANITQSGLAAKDSRIRETTLARLNTRLCEYSKNDLNSLVANIGSTQFTGDIKDFTSSLKQSFLIGENKHFVFTPLEIESVCIIFQQIHADIKDEVTANLDSLEVTEDMPAGYDQLTEAQKQEYTINDHTARQFYDILNSLRIGYGKCTDEDMENYVQEGQDITKQDLIEGLRNELEALPLLKKSPALSGFIKHINMASNYIASTGRKDHEGKIYHPHATSGPTPQEVIASAQRDLEHPDVRKMHLSTFFTGMFNGFVGAHKDEVLAKKESSLMATSMVDIYFNSINNQKTDDEAIDAIINDFYAGESQQYHIVPIQLEALRIELKTIAKALYTPVKSGEAESENEQQNPSDKMLRFMELLSVSMGGMQRREGEDAYVANIELRNHQAFKNISPAFNQSYHAGRYMQDYAEARARYIKEFGHDLPNLGAGVSSMGNMGGMDDLSNMQEDTESEANGKVEGNGNSESIAADRIRRRRIEEQRRLDSSAEDAAAEKLSQDQQEQIIAEQRLAEKRLADKR